MAVFLSRSVDLPTCLSSTARRQPSENRFARGVLIEMVGLGIEFSADHPDPLLLDPNAAGAKRPPTGGPNSGTGQAIIDVSTWSRGCSVELLPILNVRSMYLSRDADLVQLSGMVRGLSFESTPTIANRRAGSRSLAFSLTL